MDFIVIAIIVVVVAVGIEWFRHGVGSRVSKNAALDMLFEEADGWVEIVNASDEPLFRGKITGYVPDEERMLLVGGLVEDNVPEQLVSDVEPMNPQRLGDDLILARCLTFPGRDVVMGQLSDDSVKAVIEPHVASAAAIPLCVEMDSASIVVADNDESRETFDTVWQQWDLGKTPTPPNAT